MYRHEKTFLLDFIFLGIFTLLTVYNGLQLSWLGFGIWLALAVLRLIMLILHQVKWHYIYKTEASQPAKENDEEE